MKLPLKVLCVLVVAALAVPAVAQPRMDEFNGRIFPTGDPAMPTMMEGGGSGWNNGQWIYYPQTDWWNQWFYDGRPDPDRWKEIFYNIELMPAGMPGDIVEIVINWSNLEFPETGPLGRPPMPEEEWAIERSEIIFSGPVGDEPIFIWNDRPFIIPDYNPEWVSIDVRLLDWTGQSEGVLIGGWIEHECVPEPATLGLLALGGLALVRRRRRA